MKTTIIIKQITALLALLAMLTVLSCHKEEDQIVNQTENHFRGELVSFSEMGTLTPQDILQLIGPAKNEFPLDLEYSVKAYSATYYTVDAHEQVQLVSGAIFVPVGQNNLPLLSIQHGTACLREKVASVDPASTSEGIGSMIGASMGFFTITCDYIGFGVSNEPHPYMHAESLVPSVIDFIQAGKTFAGEKQLALNGQVFLTGYSEGGYISLAAQKEIEENYSEEISLEGVAPMAGPYDFSTMITDVFTSSEYPLSAYFAYFFKAYNEIYNWSKLEYIFKDPYTSMVPELFNGTKTWGQVINQLPASITELLREAFIMDYLEGSAPYIASAIEDNTLLDWKPGSPVHFIHGDADQLVPLYHAQNALEAFSSAGATHVTLTTIPGGAHETAGPEALITALAWIKEIQKSLSLSTKKAECPKTKKLTAAVS